MITFTISGIDKTIKELQDYATSLPVKLKTLVETLMYEGWDIAAAGFANALYAGTKDVTLDVPQWQDNTMYLVAHGEHVAFIEFGSGVTYEEYPADVLPEGVVEHGKYGKGQGANPPWVYVGDAGDLGYTLAKKKDGRSVVRTYGNPPARAMYDASKVLDKEHIEQVAKEIFNG